MAQGEYLGKRTTVTLDEEIYNKLCSDSKLNGLKPASRASQILSLFYNNKLVLVDTLGSVPVHQFQPMNNAETESFSINESSVTPVEVQNIPVEEVEPSQEPMEKEFITSSVSSLGVSKTKANKGKFGKK